MIEQLSRVPAQLHGADTADTIICKQKFALGRGNRSLFAAAECADGGYTQPLEAADGMLVSQQARQRRALRDQTMTKRLKGGCQAVTAGQPGLGGATDCGDDCWGREYPAVGAAQAEALLGMCQADDLSACDDFCLRVLLQAGEQSIKHRRSLQGGWVDQVDVLHRCQAQFMEKLQHLIL